MNAVALKNIERKLLSQINYVSYRPYVIKTYVDESWTDRHNPLFDNLPENELHIKVSKDFSSLLLDNEQFYLVDGNWITKEEYNEEVCECGSNKNLRRVLVGGTYFGNVYEMWCKECIEKCD